jgi:hypothetical protein
VSAAPHSGRFEILFLRAGPAAVAEFETYAASDPPARGYPGLERLPDGVDVLGTVEVTRIG